MIAVISHQRFLCFQTVVYFAFTLAPGVLGARVGRTFGRRKPAWEFLLVSKDGSNRVEMQTEFLGLLIALIGKN